MSAPIYHTLREILDTFPNGYPTTPEGTEMRILEKIFTEEEAEITTHLRMRFETVDSIALRTGRDREFLSGKLGEMQEKGQIFGVEIGEVKLYRLMPFVFGIYEFQLNRLDRELAQLVEHYMATAFGQSFHSSGPSLMKVVPIEQDIPSGSVIEPYQRLTAIIESAQSWAVADCICKKEQGLLDHPCDKPVEVCLGLSPLPNAFENFFWGRPISKDEALAVLKKAEDAGLVHLTSNVKSGHIYICNCCGCCCGMLRGINQLGFMDAVARSNYGAVVDPALCTSCGICEERCQVGAIEIRNFAEINARCIGCGLCVSTCPTGAIALKRRPDIELTDVPVDEKDWTKKRSSGRADGEAYRRLLRD